MRLAILAGEASGDQLGADLMHGLDAEFEGIGGSLMQDAGLNSLFPMDELSLMGVVEVLPRIPSLFRRIRETSEMIIEGDFDAVITIDSPDFTHRVAKKVKSIHPKLPFIHYVAPSVWAWRAGRAKKMAEYTDHVLCILPFEPPYMEAAGMSADFVGHPVTREKAPKSLNSWKKKNPNVLGLFPGSRKSEIFNHINTYRDFVNVINHDVKIQIPTSEFLHEEVSNAFEGFDNVDIFSPANMTQKNFQRAKQNLIYGADLAVVTSGTVSFEIAWAGTNCMVGYQTNFLNRLIAKRMVKVDYASLTNILLQEEAIPEFLFERFTAQNLAACYHDFQSNAGKREQQKDNYKRMRQMMIAEIEPAQAVKRFLERR